MWSKGTITNPETGVTYKYWVKHFEIGSEWGIDGGRVSKLTIRKIGEKRDACNFDRGWDVEPTEEVKGIYEQLLEKYN
jgi:hypothetical protein